MRKRNTSDRMKLKTKYTLIKKRKQRKIKLKKDMKQNPNKYHKKKSDPGVPNIAPFKAAVLKERDEYVQSKLDAKQKRREEILRIRKEIREAKVGEKRKLTDVLDLGDSNGVEEGVQVKFSEDELKLRSENNDASGSDESGDDMEVEEKPKKTRKQSAADILAWKSKKMHKAFKSSHFHFKNEPEKNLPDSRWLDMQPRRAQYRRFKEVVRDANVILEVLDARDPIGTRCSPLEQLVREEQKRLVFVLNKADLVPRKNLIEWLNYLRNEGPAVAFKAATTMPNRKMNTIGRLRHEGEETLRTSLTMGADTLLQLIKNYARSYPAGIVVGVVGLPNVGKSSLVNSLKKVKVCEVAPNPGSTKNLVQIKLDAKLHMIDCPGVVLPKRDIDPIEAVLKNVIRMSEVTNLYDCALEICKRSDMLKLTTHFNVFGRKPENGEEFIRALAKKKNCYTSGGVLDVKKAASAIVYDWNHGKLKHYTEPPKFKDGDVQSKIVTTLAKPFDLDEIAYRKEEQFLSQFDDGKPTLTIKHAPNAPVDNIQLEQELEEEVEAEMETE